MSVKDTALGVLGLLKHYLRQANDDKVSTDVVIKRYSVCDNCPYKKTFPYEFCGVCLCPLAQKLPLMYDPKQTEIQGQLVENVCPKGNW